MLSPVGFHLVDACHRFVDGRADTSQLVIRQSSSASSASRASPHRAGGLINAERQHRQRQQQLIACRRSVSQSVKPWSNVRYDSKKTCPYVMTDVYWRRRRCRSSQGEAVIYLENGLTWKHQILHEPSHRSVLQPHRKRHHYLRPVESYRRSKNGRKLGLLQLQPKFTKIGAYIHTYVHRAY